MKMILASQSPRRAQILEEAGYTFEVMPADVEERSGGIAVETAAFNAKLKAEKVSQENQDCFVIASDTVVCLDGVVIGKPETYSQACETFLNLSGKWHSVFTAVCLYKAEGRFIEFIEESRVLFKDLDLTQIYEYHKKVNPLDKAGAYNVDEFGDEIIAKIEGEYENIMGLPMKQLSGFLQEFS